MAERASKLCALSELVSRIPDGARLAIGGFAVYQKPMAAVREIVRQRKKNLTIVGTVHSMDVDMLVGAGCVARVETSYVGMEKYGLAPNFRRAVQSGAVTVVHYPEMLAWDRFRADREGWPYWPSYSLGGCDGVLNNPEIVEYRCPVSGRRVWALPAARPDAVLIHAYQGDCYGNIRLQPHSMLPQAMDVEMARSCGTVLATVEELVEHEAMKATPHLNLIPAMRTTAICAAPFGSHPLSTLLKRKEDETHMREYMAASKTEDGFRAYLDKYVYHCKDEAEYLALVETAYPEQLEERQ